MKKILYTTILLGFLSLCVSAQQYTYISMTGTNFPYSNNPSAQTPATALLQVSGSTVNDQLSPWVNLPFTWNFYGKPVTGFKVSDNGYITFDPNATTSFSANDSLSKSSAPNNCIFALWTDLDLRTLSSGFNSNVLYWTYGRPGNRIFYITWNGASNHAVSGSNVMTFTIRLFETGGFDISYNYQDGNIGTIKATVGCKNSDGTKYVMIPPSPSFGFPVAYNANGDVTTDDVIYRFFYGTQQKYDLGIMYASMPEKATKSSTGNAVMFIENRGSQNLSTYNINVSVNGGTPTVVAASALNANTVVGLNVSIPTPSVNGRYKVKAWTSIPSQTDSTPSDDSIAGPMFVVNGNNQYEKHPMVEEFTGAWCGYCPNGITKISGLLGVYWDAIVVAVHQGFGNPANDQMGFPDGEAIASRFSIGYPSANIDRVFWGDQGSIAINRISNTDTNLFLTKYAIERAGTSPVQVNLIQTYDSTTRNLSVTISPKFSDSVLLWKLKYNVYIVQEEVAGNTGNGWDQHNYSAQHDVPGNPYYMQGNQIGSGVWSMSPFIHRHVLRAVLGGPTGKSATFNNPITFDTQDPSYNMTFTTTIPSSWGRQDGIRVIGFMNYDDQSGDPNKSNEVVGAAMTSLFDTQSGIKNDKNAVAINEVYPNPGDGNFTAQIHFNDATKANFQVSDITGKVVMDMPYGQFNAGNQDINFNLTTLNPGVYFLTVKSNVGSYTQKIVITR